MIVGLKYAGASDGFPTRINVGDIVKLRVEGTEVSAYHNDRKVGYLSPDKLRLWNSLRPSARNRATVVGEIIDEDGNIAGLDVEISARSAAMPRAAAKTATRPRETPKTNSGSKPYRAGIGLAVLLASIAVMGHVNTTGPDRSAIASEASLTFGTASILSLKPSFEPFPEDGQELRRQVQLTSVHRMADETRRREAAAELKLEAEEQKGRTLQTALEQARQASLLQLKRIEELEEQARQSAAEQESENVRLHNEIASLQQKIEQLAIAKQRVEAAERQTAWRNINDEELVRHKNRLYGVADDEPRPAAESGAQEQGDARAGEARSAGRGGAPHRAETAGRENQSTRKEQQAGGRGSGQEKEQLQPLCAGL